MRPAELDLIIVGTCSPDYLFPATACLVQKELGAERAGAFDIEAACTSFVSALAVANGMILAGTHRNALVIGAECLSRLLNFKDRTTCVLFGDGAGAVVLEASNASVGVESAILHSDGSKGELLWVEAGGSRVPATTETVAAGKHFIRMEGGETFKLAVKSMADAAEEALIQANVTADEIDLLIPHQANLRIIQKVAERLRFPMDKVFVNIQRYGNTSAASIPIALAEAAETGRLKKGDRVLLAAFGGGFTWGASVMEWWGVPIPDRREKTIVERAQRRAEDLLDKVLP
jgi:3-oxoacyl-[acyl-carrier-protein] synthase-3